ncbi:DNA topoisomerase IB [Actinomadura fulvescens]|uniref:DNA topoisomerase n=1 Tax=Actinomadura fulvescens TaxID=46160 RepID=A0ABP6CER3_9ACTN
MTVLDHRLSRSRLDLPGYRRLRCGDGFSYLDPDGRPVDDPAELARITGLGLPPAWHDVWICPDPWGHIQAVGTDAAGRRQYRYHELWRTERDRTKFDRALQLGERLPGVRSVLDAHLAGRGLARQRVLAAAVTLLDVAFFRVGGERYAEHGSYGLATLRHEHVRCTRGAVQFHYRAKSGRDRRMAVTDPRVCRVIRGLMHGPDGELLGYRMGERWHPVHSAEINAYLKDIAGGPFSAKDFRTWNATVLAAVGLAVSAPGERRAVTRVVREVSEYLGNTPAVCRASYIDPRVVESYERGVTVRDALPYLGVASGPGQPATWGPFEAAVVDLLREG